MKRIASALIRSTLAHLLIAGAVIAFLGFRGDWLSERLRLGSAHPAAIVQLHWSGKSGAAVAATPPRPTTKRTQRDSSTPTDQNQTTRSVGDSGQNTLPSGTLVAVQGSPEYPSLSRRSGEQGTVTLEFFLNSEGMADAIEVLQSSGHRRLDESALQFLKSTRLTAPNGALPNQKLNLSFIFKLED